MEGEPICSLCQEGVIQDTDRDEMTLVEGVPVRKRDMDRADLWVHEVCLNHASKKRNELARSTVERVLRDKMVCSDCGKPFASVGCLLPACRSIYHYPCASKTGRWVPNTGFYCPRHLHYIKKHRKKVVHWPKEVSGRVKYVLKNDWSAISPKIIDLIAQNSSRWEQYALDWDTSITSHPIQIRAIERGHWAWSEELFKVGQVFNGHDKQFEVFASRDFVEDEIIGEYVGVVRLVSEDVISKYTATVFMPPDLPLELAGLELVIDAQHDGNETRFINSVTASSPPFIKQNASMRTLWTGDQLRILLVATRNIPSGHPVVVDYNEFAETYFEEPDIKET
eukprot:TRINITY_DN14341_c0_g1_i1.p1 TRINITY_DN14341_c0_g1~~TRINITY_DN14341_c0_g1_i1.p1  ORF type:complete len:395 (+),score=28.29 TRINITY_DN14341_c0_g1_i1:174-1187(+)